METSAVTTELYKAAARGKVGALEEMMQKQPDVDIFALETSAVTTELYKAAARGKVGALEEMMQKQPNVDILALDFRGGKTALHISAFYGREDFVEKLVQLNKERDEEAANEEQRGSFLRVQNEEGNTALHEAVRGGDHDQIVEMLIEADSELAGIRNNKGESPLFIASAKGRLDALKWLLLIKDSLYYVRHDGQTCLHHALLHKKYEVAETLIREAPALCTLADYWLGNTPLHIAATRGCPENIVEELLQFGPRSAFTQSKIKRQTALHMAAQHGHLGVVRCILSFAEDCIEMRDGNGKTALHHAVENAQVGAVMCLVRLTTIIDIADNNGYTALDIAKQKYEEEPLSPYLAIRFLFRISKTITGVEAAENQTIKTSKPFSTEGRYSTTINGLSVCAILIATVTFQAAFTLPPHQKDKNVSAGLFDHDVFYSFVVNDMLAFCFSMAAAILLAYATFFRRHRSLVVAVSALFLSFALYTMIFSFSSAMFLQINQEYHMLAAFFYYSMYVIAPTSSIAVSLVLKNALGFSIVEYVRAWRFRIKSAFTWLFSAK